MWGKGVPVVVTGTAGALRPRVFLEPTGQSGQRTIPKAVPIVNRAVGLGPAPEQPPDQSQRPRAVPASLVQAAIGTYKSRSYGLGATLQQ